LKICLEGHVTQPLSTFQELKGIDNNVHNNRGMIDVANHHTPLALGHSQVRPLMGFITLTINCNPEFGNFHWVSSCPCALLFLCFGSFCVSPISPSSSPFDSRPLLLSERSNEFEPFCLLDPCTPFLKSRTRICGSRRLSCLVLLDPSSIPQEPKSNFFVVCCVDRVIAIASL
jgi:hypothetical protein